MATSNVPINYHNPNVRPDYSNVRPAPADNESPSVQFERQNRQNTRRQSVERVTQKDLQVIRQRFPGSSVIRIIRDSSDYPTKVQIRKANGKKATVYLNRHSQIIRVVNHNR